MAAYDVNQRCEDCTFADAFGRDCKHGMMFPLLVLLSYGDVYKCPNFQKKTSDQLIQQNEIRNSKKQINT